MRRYPLIIWGVGMLLGSSLCPSAYAAPVVAPRPITSPVQLPRFQGTKLPEPPRQDDPWVIPEVDLPAEVLLLVHTLFEQGLADPRGCEYREIGIMVAGGWRNGDMPQPHGWVLPRDSREDPAFAVCWNGLVTPVQSVGDRVSLAEDFARRIESLEQARREDEQSPIGFHGFRDYATTGVQPVSSSGIAVCLLLRLGKTEKAEHLYRVLTPPQKGHYSREPTYLDWARDWLWFGFYRSILAFGRGDDKLALLGMKQVMDAYSEVEAEAKERDLEPQPTFRDRKIATPYARFLRQAPAIIADLERRTKAGQSLPTRPPPRVRTPAFAPRVKTLAQRPTAELIQKLQNARGRRWSNPGAIRWGYLPVVAALRGQGTAAVGELLDAWESDQRLTRTVDGRSSHRRRRIPTVSTVAADLVQEILDNPSFKSIADARKYWEANKGRSPAERWYHTLLDDTAGREPWLNAAENIVENESWRKNGSMIMRKWPAPGRQLDLTLHGESLRSKSDPSVMELFTQRAKELSVSGEAGSRRRWRMEAACSLAMAAVRWDEDKALPLVNNQFDRTLAFALARRRGHGPNRDEELTGEIVNLTMARLKLGDRKQAFHEYGDFLDGFDPNSIDFNDKVRLLLKPIWRNPTDQASRILARKLFTRPDSPWTPFLQNTARVVQTEGLLSGPMLGVEAFREHLLEQLANTTRVGIFLCNPDSAPHADVHRVTSPDEEGFVRVQAGWASNELYWGRAVLEIEPADPLAPSNGDKIPVRVCDVYAAAISPARGMPWFEFYWPLEKREKARKVMIERLKQYGGRYVFDDELSDHHGGFSIQAVMSFPTLDHPATAEDVAKGRAIFSLGDDHKRRLVEGMEFPVTARWKSLREHPYQRRTYNPRTDERKVEVMYYQEGRIWQAEEVLIDGQWRRFYGFVGNDVLSKVPAEPIEFIEKKPWMSLR